MVIGDFEKVEDEKREGEQEEKIGGGMLVQEYVTAHTYKCPND